MLEGNGGERVDWVCVYVCVRVVAVKGEKEESADFGSLLSTSQACNHPVVHAGLS